MAECHPVGFQWVMEAKARGATVIHVDPRFTRTSALADLHVPLRAGYRHRLPRRDHQLRPAATRSTSASTWSPTPTPPMIIGEEFADTEDLDGVFSGLDREHRIYDPHSWQYEGAGGAGRVRGTGPPVRGPGPGSVGPAGRRAARRTAPAAPTCGAGEPRARRDAAAPALRVPGPQAALRPLHAGDGRADLRRAAGAVPAGLRAADRELGPGAHDRVRVPVGWTQHTVGVQYIRTASILQLLLGNIGRPGGGILALRGHASIQGSTDIPTLFNLLPGYIPMPHAHANQDLGQLRRGRGGDEGLLGEHARLHGEPAQGLVGRGRDGGQRLLLRLPAPAHRQPQHLRDGDGPARREAARATS